jgi:hypothetical protein
MRKGLIITALLGLITNLAALEVSMKFPDLVNKPDADGHQVPTAIFGEVFAVDIEISGAHEGTDEVEVKGFEPFKIIGKSVTQSSSTSNGKTTSVSTIRLQVKSFKAGIHKVGPIKVRSGKITATSGEFFCQIEPKKKAKEEQSAGDKSHIVRTKDQALEVELIPSKSEVYWGESFDVTIRYIAHDQIYQLVPEVPEQANFFKKDIQNRGWRQISRNGIVSKVYEQVVTFLPVKAGAAAIGPMHIHYSVPAKQQQFSSGGMEQFFSMAFGPQAEQKEVDVPAVNIFVKSLPKTKKQTSLVGIMTGFDISVDKPTVQVNEPIKLVVNITGRGNLEFTEEIPLNLPQGSKVFKAKASMLEVPGSKGISTKKIEYILQVNKSGRMEFPVQELRYFDPEAGVYKSLSSEPIELFLTGDVVAEPTKTVDELAREVTDDSLMAKKDNRQGFIFDEPGYGDVAMSWWMFLLLMLLPLGLYVRTLLGWLNKELFQRLKKEQGTQSILNQAEKEVASIIAAGSATKLYQFFIKLLAKLWRLHEQEVTEQVIEQRLAQGGWKDDRIREFVNYLQMCASLHFTRQIISAEICEMLLKKSQYWVLLFGK